MFYNSIAYLVNSVWSLLWLVWHCRIVSPCDLLTSVSKSIYFYNLHFELLSHSSTNFIILIKAIQNYWCAISSTQKKNCIFCYNRTRKAFTHSGNTKKKFSNKICYRTANTIESRACTTNTNINHKLEHRNSRSFNSTAIL